MLQDPGPSPPLPTWLEATAGLAHSTPFRGELDDPRWLVPIVAFDLAVGTAVGVWLLARTLPPTRRERRLHAASAVAPLLLAAAVVSLPFGDPAGLRLLVNGHLVFLLAFAATVLAPRPWTAALAFLAGLTAIAAYEVGALLGALPDGGQDRPAGTFLLWHAFLTPFVLAAAAIRTRNLWPAEPSKSA